MPTTKIENTNEKITSLTGRVSANESKIKNTINVNEEQQAQLNSHNSILANDIPAIYETKNDANAKLTEAKEYSDDATLLQMVNELKELETNNG